MHGLAQQQLTSHIFQQLHCNVCRRLKHVLSTSMGHLNSIRGGGRDLCSSHRPKHSACSASDACQHTACRRHCSLWERRVRRTWRPSSVSSGLQYQRTRNIVSSPWRHRASIRPRSIPPDRNFCRSVLRLCNGCAPRHRGALAAAVVPSLPAVATTGPSASQTGHLQSP